MRECQPFHNVADISVDCKRPHARMRRTGMTKILAEAEWPEKENHKETGRGKP